MCKITNFFVPSLRISSMAFKNRWANRNTMIFEVIPVIFTVGKRLITRDKCSAVVQKSYARLKIKPRRCNANEFSASFRIWKVREKKKKIMKIVRQNNSFPPHHHTGRYRIELFLLRTRIANTERKSSKYLTASCDATFADIIQIIDFIYE